MKYGQVYRAAASFISTNICHKLTVSPKPYDVALQDTAYAIASTYLTFSLLFCGFYVAVNNMVLSVARALTWASYSKYTFQALTVNEFQSRVWTEGCNSSRSRESPLDCSLIHWSVIWYPLVADSMYLDRLYPHAAKDVAGSCIYKLNACMGDFADERPAAQDWA